MPEQGGLGARLRALRQTWDDVTVNQRHLSQALGISGALISSWENGQAIPPEDRLHAYARFFATRRSMDGQRPALVSSEDLTKDEEDRRQVLIDELSGLRDEALADEQPRNRERGALGGRFWYFPDDQPVTILCSPLSIDQLGYTEEAAVAGKLPPAVQYATNPTHPNYVRNLGNGDIDSLVELAAHIRAENPTSDVRWMTLDRLTGPDDLTGHVVILGVGDASQLPAGRSIDVFEEFKSRLELPVDLFWPDDADPEFGGAWAMHLDGESRPDPRGQRTELERPRFVREEDRPDRPFRTQRGARLLTADAALIVRMRNPLNAQTTVSLFSGIFSRGTYGAVRAFTDEKYRARNEQWIADNVDPDSFWLLAQVTIFAGETTITPDLTRPATRLWRSS